MNHSMIRQVLDCACPLALWNVSGATQSGRGLPQSKTLARLGLLLGCCQLLQGQSNDPNTQALAREARPNGGIVFGAKTVGGDWDLFAMRPDGSAPTVLGKAGEFPWASWSPDGKMIVCLSPKGIDFVDLASKKAVRHLDRQGFFQQLIWSPDGQWLSGVANSFDTGWSVARMDAASGKVNPVNKVDCCTPDWFSDSRRIVFSWRPPGQKANAGYGWTQLWMADGEGKERRLIFAEDGRHVYGGCISPDGKYVLFTGNKEEDGDAQNGGAPMGLMRLADAPIIRGDQNSLRQQHPNARPGPVLPLPGGWEPHWTAIDSKPIP